MERICTAWFELLERGSRFHICWEILSCSGRGYLERPVRNEDLGGSVSIESGCGCVTAGRCAWCVRVHVCFAVCICGVRFCTDASMLLYVAVDVFYGDICVIRIYVCLWYSCQGGGEHK